ncbi:dirigent protein 22-like [Prosopis cineraria]|uniref:dirigent protein 22-like n=1 Tax=Prosopis cineraria TaxID=364024 RepID=UPI0024103A63|nr:dirigent protein 22-like [Prosopis cineraria]
MALPLSLLIIILFSITIFSTYISTINGAFSEHNPIALTTTHTQKTTHLHFFFHDTLDGKNPSAVRIISPEKSNFGTTFMTDDPLTEGPELTSKLVGRAQGMYASASQHDVVLLMVMNYAFIEGIYRGSSLSVLGRNPPMEDVREMPIVGGSGLFRFARGYALAHTLWFDPKSGSAVVEYNVTVIHF